jgi:hypothetical protein
MVEFFTANFILTILVNNGLPARSREVVLTFFVDFTIDCRYGFECLRQNRQ